MCLFPDHFINCGKYEEHPLLTVECGEGNSRVCQVVDVKERGPLFFELADIWAPRLC